MEEVKKSFQQIVSLRLAAAPDCVAKAELIEELAENLTCRYQDLVNAGVEPVSATQRAVDALGDTDELVEYLKGLEPDQPLPQMVRDPDKEDDGQLEELLKNVEDIVKGAMKKAKTAFGEVKEQLKDSGVWTSKDGKAEVHVEAGPVSEPTPEPVPEPEPAVAEPEAQAQAEEEDEAPIKIMMDDMMKDIKSVLRQSKNIAKEAVNTAFEASAKFADEVKQGIDPDPGAVVEADSPIGAAQLRGIEVQSGSGDVVITMSQDPDGDVLVGGDADDLEVFLSEEGVLTIRPARNETRAFFMGRGMFSSGADVELELPCREWDFVKIATASGNVEITGNAPVGEVAITTTSGDVTGELSSCGKLACHSTSGDVNWKGDCGQLQLSSTSGDIDFCGAADQVRINSISGDGNICCYTVPAKLDVNTTSGDLTVVIPDGEAFTARFRTTSGDFTSDFFVGHMNRRDCRFTYKGGGQRSYSFTTISGDLELYKYRG